MLAAPGLIKEGNGVIMNAKQMNRRDFLQLTALAMAGSGFSVAASDLGDRQPLKLGVASYSLRKFPLDQALAMTRELGVPGITLKDVHLPLRSSRAERHTVARQVKDAGLDLLGVGVIYMRKANETEIPHLFDYAREVGAPNIVCSPEPGCLDLVEKCARETSIRVAIHNHGPDDKKFTMYASPVDAFKLVKDRDPLLGVCLDVGHTVRLGEDPIAAINTCAPRLYDFHLKDVTAATAAGKCTVLGKGVIDLPAVLKALVGINYSHHVALEYEIDENDPLPGMKASIAFVRAKLARLQ